MWGPGVAHGEGEIEGERGCDGLLAEVWVAGEVVSVGPVVGGGDVAVGVDVDGWFWEGTLVCGGDGGLRGIVAIGHDGKGCGGLEWNLKQYDNLDRVNLEFTDLDSLCKSHGRRRKTSGGRHCSLSIQFIHLHPRKYHHRWNPSIRMNGTSRCD